MMDLFKEYVKPELLILIPVLYLIGMGLKKSSVADRHIPWILGGAGVLLAGLYILATGSVGTLPDGALAAFSAVTQGVLAAGASVYVNQLLKQAGKGE